MTLFNDDVVQEIWESATIFKPENASAVRLDACGAYISRSGYNGNSKFGWRIVNYNGKLIPLHQKNYISETGEVVVKRQAFGGVNAGVC